MGCSDLQVDRNLKGIEFEKKGDIEGAKLLYLKNIEEKTDTPHPYERLSLIYKKEGKYKEALEVIDLFFKSGVQNPRIVEKLTKRKEQLFKKRQERIFSKGFKNE